MFARQSGVSHLCVLTADTKEHVSLRQYLEGLSIEEYELVGPALALRLWFPRPRFANTERWSEADEVRSWAHRLQELPVRHAVLHIPGEPSQVIRVVEVKTHKSNPRSQAAYLDASRRANGQPTQTVGQLLDFCAKRVDQIASGQPIPGEKDDTREDPHLRKDDTQKGGNDGSLF